MRLTNQRYTEIKSKVAVLLEKLGVNSLPILGLDLAKRMGIKIIKYSEAPSDMLEKLIKVSSDGFTAYHNGERIICYNDDDKINKQRINYTICHEIGHVYLDHMEHNVVNETEADFFAEYLICPLPLLEYFEYTTDADIMKHFFISKEATNIILDHYDNWIKYKERNCKENEWYEQKIINLFK